MKDLKETLETRQNLHGLYWFKDNSLEPVEYLFKDSLEPPVQLSKEPLTPDNFGMILNNKVYTVDDFRWYKEDGSDLDYLRYDDSYSILTNDDLPPEVFVLLNGVIGVKFATRCLLRAKEIIDTCNNADAKQSLNHSITIFNNEDINGIKLLIAADALSSASKAVKDINNDFSCQLNKYATLITQVHSKICEKWAIYFLTSSFRGF